MPFMIAFAEKLRTEYSSSRNRAKNGDVEYKYELIYDRYAVHLLSSDLTYHYVVDQTDEICNEILQYHWKNHENHVFVKNSVPYVLFCNFFKHNFTL